jgi:hypothetical protein
MSNVAIRNAADLEVAAVADSAPWDEKLVQQSANNAGRNRVNMNRG